MAADGMRRDAEQGLYPCPHCAGTGQGVFGDDGVKVACPSCGGAGYLDPPGGDGTSDGPPARKASPAHWLVIVLGAGLGVALAMAALVGIVDSCEGVSSSSRRQAASLPETARTLVRERVLGTAVPADFAPDSEDRITAMGDGRYLVSSYVDVHDEAAGAKVRRRYTLVLHRDPAEGWVMESVAMVP